MELEPECYELINIYPDECARNLVADITKLESSYDTIVDIGCGTGYLCELLAQSVKHKRIIGVDIDHRMISYANQKHKSIQSIDYWLQDMSQPWDELRPEIRALESNVSLIVSNYAIQWIADKRQLWGVVNRLLAPNGQFVANIVLIPDLMSRFTDEQRLEFELQYETKPLDKQLIQIKSDCIESGLDVVDSFHCDQHWRQLRAEILDEYETFGRFGPIFMVSDKKSLKFSFMRNVLMDVLLRPKAVGPLNANAFTELRKQCAQTPEGYIDCYITVAHFKCLKFK